MRRRPCPLRVTRPPPSSTTARLVLRTLAVARIRIVTGRGPHAKRIVPPPRTAATTRAEVQLAAVPCPTVAARAGAVAEEATPASTHRQATRTARTPGPYPGLLRGR